jgi:hypothetical protein
LLVVHDHDDDEIGWTEGAAIAASWPGAQLVTTSGLGHRRVLRDEHVAARAAAFLANASDPRPQCGHAPGWAWEREEECPTCALEMDLFDRPGRWERLEATIAARRHA